MKILLNNNDLNEALHNVSRLGFVPTMGSLHDGHKSLIKRSKRECKKTLVSIFVNPHQFNSKSDYRKYPRNNKKDLSILKTMNVDYVYLPKKDQIYDFVRKYKIQLYKKDKILCAKHRKGHFEGVIDVMDRLTGKIKPKKIFLGEKDMQQLYLVKSYIEKRYKSKIIPCKTIRDSHGLALSSRNLLLNRQERKKARNLMKYIFRIKKSLKNQTNINKFIKEKKTYLSNIFGINIEYLEMRNIKNFKISTKIKNSRLFIAFYVNKVRLIDNI